MRNPPTWVFAVIFAAFAEHNVAAGPARGASSRADNWVKDYFEAKGGCANLTTGTLDSQVFILPFSTVKEIPSVFGQLAHELSDNDIEEIIKYAANCFQRKYPNSATNLDGLFRRKLVAIVTTSKELIRQDQTAKAAQERLRQQQA